MSDKTTLDDDVEGELLIEEIKGDDKQNAFVEKHLTKRKRPKRTRRKDRKEREESPDQRYEKALEAVRPMLEAADRVAEKTRESKSIAKARDKYVDIAGDHEGMVPADDYVQALYLLNERVAAAGILLSASAKRDIRMAKSRQAKEQDRQYRELDGISDGVKRSCITEGTAIRIEKNLPGGDSRAFAPVLQAVRYLEEARINVRPGTPVEREHAEHVHESAQSLMEAARKFLQYAASLNPQPEGKALATLESQKRECQTLMRQAYQLSLAMDCDMLPQPSRDTPWSEEDQIRATGLQTALAFERSGQVATKLVGGGASTSYWLRDKDIDTLVEEQGSDAPGKGDRLFIFKPTQGEASDMTVPLGAGAVKEALASANSRLFAQQTGIDFGVPTTSVVSINSFALEGGDPAAPPILGSAQRNAGGHVAELREVDPAILARVPKEDVHKIALLDILSLSCDRHSGNLMIDTSDPATPRMIPIDHGGTLPTPWDFPVQCERLGGIAHTSGRMGSHNTLLKNPTAFEPFDPQMLTQLSRLDPEAMEAGMKRERAALGRVHPDLKPEEKVGDESLRMSKRAMMFTKLAAKLLSPAEIQIAIANFGDDLFAAGDDDFDRVAKRIIKQQITKKSAYQEILFLPPEQQRWVCEWLVRNGWVQSDRHGVLASSGFLMRDPVTALKLFKAGKPNPNPIGKPDIPPSLPPEIDGEGEDASQAIVDEFSRQFGDVVDPEGEGLTSAQVNAVWAELQALGGRQEYDRMLEVAGGKPDKYLRQIMHDLRLWTRIKDAGLQDRLAGGPTRMSRTDKLRFTLAAEGVKQPNAQVEQSAAMVSSQITEEDYLKNFDKVFATLVQTIDGLLNPDLRQPFAELLAGVRTSVDDKSKSLPEGIQSLQNLRYEIGVAMRTERKQKFTRTYDKLMAIIDRKQWPDNAKVSRDSLKSSLTFDFDGFDTWTDVEQKQKLINLLEKYKMLREYPDLSKVEVTPQDDLQQDDDLPVGEPLAQENEVEDQFDDDGSEIQQIENIQPVVDPPRNAEEIDSAGPLTAFGWHESMARAVVKFAIDNGYFKKQKTGLGEHIRAVKAARNKVKTIKATTSVKKQEEYLREAETAYDHFGVFVASRLRLLSDRPHWVAYCNMAAREVDQQLKDVRENITRLRRIDA